MSTSTPTATTAPARLPSATEIGPVYTLDQGKYGSTMRISDWTIVSTKRPILNGKEIDLLEKSLNLPLPEMTFGNNSLVLTYTPDSSSAASSSSFPSPTSSTFTSTTPSTSGLQIRFDASSALAYVATGEGWEERVGGGVLVSMAESWSKSRSTASVLSDTPMLTKPVRPHDWTYSTTYAGEVCASSLGSALTKSTLPQLSTLESSTAGPSFQPTSTHSIPLPLLARQDPIADRILYYDDVPLFEDELHDFGESILNVRIRVMPHSFFILSRLFVRVDNVLFRILDVRVYHEFGSGKVVREVSGLEEGYEKVKGTLDKKEDLSPLTDANYVYQVMTRLAASTGSAGVTGAEGGAVAGPCVSSSGTGASQGDRPSLHHRSSSRSSGKPWPGLGRRVEVLHLPGTEFFRAKLASLSL